MSPKIGSLILYIAGVVLMAAGVLTWITISNQLAAENIVVSSDAPCQAGQEVNGPIEAYCQAEIINEHALKSTGGKTYAELPQDDPKRTTAMQASFLRASLFTSVVSFGVAAFAFGMGILMLIIAASISGLARRTAKAMSVAAA